MAEKMTERKPLELEQEISTKLKEFKRLHGVKQLGFLCDVYGKDITHTRLSYSIKLFLKAEQIVQQLKKNQPELNITDQDVMCVALAGLCYNLGQPPLSYDFWGIRNRKTGFFDEDELWRESCKLLDTIWPKIIEMDIWNCNKVKLSMEDKAFVKALMRGKEKNLKELDGYPLRHEGKDFLYEMKDYHARVQKIVNNKYNGLDVKLFTYLIEDATNLRIEDWSSTFAEIEEMTETAKVTFVNEFGVDTTRSHIAYSEKFQHLIVQLFQKKEYLHRTVYQNPEHRANVIWLSDAYKRNDQEVAAHKFSTLTDEKFLSLLHVPSVEQKSKQRKYKLAAQVSILVKKEKLGQLKKELANIRHCVNDTIQVDVIDYSDAYVPGHIWIYSHKDQVRAYSMASPPNRKSEGENQGHKEDQRHLRFDEIEYYPYTECSIRWYENIETGPRNPNDGETFMRHQKLLEKKCNSFSRKQFFFDALYPTRSIWLNPLVVGAGCGIISGWLLLPGIRSLTCRIIVNATYKEMWKSTLKSIKRWANSSVKATGAKYTWRLWLNKMMSAKPGTLTHSMRKQGNVFKWFQIIFWFTAIGFASSAVRTYMEKHKKKYEFTRDKTNAASWCVLGGGYATVAIMAESKSTIKAHVVKQPLRLYGSIRGSPFKALAIGLFPVLLQQVVQNFSPQSIPVSYG